MALLAHPLNSTRVARAALALAALGLGSWALTAARFRDAEGFLDGGACFLISLAAALSLIAASPRRLARSAAWLGLLIAGQAASLQLIDAGPRLHYQHLVAPDQMPAVPLLVLAIEGVAVAMALLPSGVSAGRGLRRAGSFALVLVSLACLVSAAAPSADPRAYLLELPLAFGLQLLHLGALVLGVRALPESGPVSPWPRVAPAREEGADPWVVGAAAWVVLVSGLLAVTSYERHPHVPDEVAYLYQARLLAAGRLTLPAPPVAEAFEIYLFEHDGERWYPTTTPGWPAILAAGVLAGAPWLVNPVLGGLGILLAFSLLRPLLGASDARAASLLLAASPWYLFTSMSFMTHAATLTAALAAGVALDRSRRTGRWRWVLGAGAACGLGGLVRPVDGLIVAGLLAAATLVLRLGWPRLVLLASCALVVGSLVLPFNSHLTGDPLTPPLSAYSARYFAPHIEGLGFGPSRGRGWPLDPYPGHGPRDALINGTLNAFSIQTDLFGWACGSILFAAWAVVRARRRIVWTLLAPIVAVFGVYFFYYYSGGPDFGARYWYLMIVPLAGLTVLGLRQAAADLAAPVARLAGAAVLLTLAALAAWVPWRAIDKYHHFRGMRADLAQTGFEAHEAPLVLIRGARFPDYASAAIYNPLDWNAPEPLYAREVDSSTVESLRAAFPGREILYLEGPTVTGRGYSVSSPVAPR